MRRSPLPPRRTPLSPGQPLRNGKPLERKTSLEAGKGSKESACAVDGCDQPRRRREWCGRHHRRWLKHGDVNRVDRPGLREEVRFAKMVMPGLPSDYRPDLGPCLLFTGSHNGNGYGQFRYNGHGGYAHRYAWERVNGPIPAGLTVDHLCMVRCCVEITHLELVDGPTNTRRGIDARTMCKNGMHERIPENQYMRRGRLNCLPCLRATQQRYTDKTRLPPGTPRPQVKFDQTVVRAQIALVRSGELPIAQAARIIGCNPNYLGRRIWQETRKDVLVRDEDVCVRCGAAVAEEVHHRRARGSGGTSDPLTSFGMANLISLCSPCHEHVTNHPEESYPLGLMCRRGTDFADHPVQDARRGWIRLDNAGGVTSCDPPAVGPTAQPDLIPGSAHGPVRDVVRYEGSRTAHLTCGHVVVRKSGAKSARVRCPACAENDTPKRKAA